MMYVVRLWDGWDGEWMDVHGPCDKGEADRVCGDRNAARSGSSRGVSLKGKREGSYSDGDYYRVFPTGLKMVFSDGRSQTRN